MRLHQAPGLGERFGRRQAVVAIKKERALAAKTFDSRLPCHQRSVIFLASQQDEARITLREPLADLRRAVRAAVVHDEKLRILERLASQALKALLEIGRDVVDRDAD